ncbi:MAG: hypothetical protein AAFR58_02670 [Cyanobacteria bacterium J06627_28]
MSNLLTLTAPPLPLLGSARVSFETVEGQPAFCKRLLIDGEVVHTVSAIAEPDDYQVYVGYLSALRVIPDLDRRLAQSLSPEQLRLLNEWMSAKTDEYQHRLGEESVAAIGAMSADLARVMQQVEPVLTTTEMTAQLGQYADVLEANQAKKIAQKLRMVGNLISRIQPAELRANAD